MAASEDSEGDEVPEVPLEELLDDLAAMQIEDGGSGAGAHAHAHDDSMMD
jgi:hypothetical protein